MGIWGVKPWESDGAADWYSSLFSSRDFASFVEAGLRLDPKERCEEIRAASYVLVALGKPGIWPIRRLRVDLVSAISALRGIIDVGVLDDDREISDRLKEDVALLECRLRDLRSS